MQNPQISTILALQIIRDYGAESDYHKESTVIGTEGRPFVFEIIAQKSERAPKQAWRKIEKLNKYGYVAYGSSPRIPWLTDRGKDYLHYLESRGSEEKPDTTFTYAEKSWSRKQAPAIVTISDTKPELCTHCGRTPAYVVASINPFSKKRQFKCKCGVAGPIITLSDHDVSSSYRESIILWNSVMHGVKRYGRKTEQIKTVVLPDS